MENIMRNTIAKVIGWVATMCVAAIIMTGCSSESTSTITVPDIDAMTTDTDNVSQDDVKFSFVVKMTSLISQRGGDLYLYAADIPGATTEENMVIYYDTSEGRIFQIYSYWGGQVIKSGQIETTSGSEILYDPEEGSIVYSDYNGDMYKIKIDSGRLNLEEYDGKKRACDDLEWKYGKDFPL